jgi:hypothetical protein
MFVPFALPIPPFCPEGGDGDPRDPTEPEFEYVRLASKYEGWRYGIVGGEMGDRGVGGESMSTQARDMVADLLTKGALR